MPEKKATAESRQVSDDLLASFDKILDGGNTLPLEEIKRRYVNSGYFRYRERMLYEDIIDLPLTVDMILGDKTSAASRIMADLKELYGDDLIIKFGKLSDDEATLKVSKWKSEEKLREQWREFAEDEYRDEMLGGAK